MEARDPRGPGAFFGAHPVAFALSVAGAWATSGYSFVRAARSAGRRRAGLIALGLLTALEGAGIVLARRRGRRA